MDLTTIYNFKAVDESLATAGQPNGEQLQAIADADYTLVINLGTDDPRYSLAGEDLLVSGLGMGYVHIPVEFDKPGKNDYLAFRNTMDSSSGQKRLVHCAANFRVSAFMSIYGEERLGWSRQQAEEFIQDGWDVDDIWQQFLQQRRAEIEL